MFNKASLLFFLLLVQLMFSNAITKKDTVSLKINEKVQQLFDIGMQEYTNGKYKEAIATWKTVVIKAEEAKIEQLAINTNTNIGACYNALGYHKTALSYFLKTDKLLSAMGPKKDIYWINHINIGVCYMSIEQWDLAKYYFDQTINYNDHVVFLKYLNLAKWNAEKGNKIAFFRYQIKLNNLISKFPTYKDPWDEMQLDFLTLWEEKSRLKVLLQELQSDYNNGSIYTKLAYNNAFFLVHGRLYEKLSNVLAYNQEIVQENNFYLKDLYYSLLKNNI